MLGCLIKQGSCLARSFCARRLLHFLACAVSLSPPCFFSFQCLTWTLILQSECLLVLFYWWDVVSLVMSVCCLCLSLSFSVFLCLSLSFSVFLSLSLSFGLSLSPLLCPSLSFSLSLSLSLCLSVPMQALLQEELEALETQRSSLRKVVGCWF